METKKRNADKGSNYVSYYYVDYINIMPLIFKLPIGSSSRNFKKKTISNVTILLVMVYLHCERKIKNSEISGECLEDKLAELLLIYSP